MFEATATITETAQRQRERLETALNGLIRLLKTVRFYPSGHPSLRGVLGETRRALALLAEPGEEALSWEVRRRGFVFRDQPVAPGHPGLQKFAAYLFARLVTRIDILREISEEELLAFARCLLLDPPDLQRRGGIRASLLADGVVGVRINEMELAELLAPPDEKLSPEEAGGGAIPEPLRIETSPAERSLDLLLRQLQQAPDDEAFRCLLYDLPFLVRESLHAGSRPLVLKAIAILAWNASDAAASAPRRQDARLTLDALADDELIDHLLGFLCTVGLPDSIVQTIVRVLVYLRERGVRRVMERLAAEENPAFRNRLRGVLLRHGPELPPMLSPFLRDRRIPLVCRAVGLLGEVRHPETLGRLVPLLYHDDPRVRREAIRALARQGGAEARSLLLQVVRKGETDLALQALLGLGAMRDPEAVPPLLRLVRQADFLNRRAELKKGAIHALGLIGAETAVPCLAALLRRRRWGRRHDQLRAAAATALGEIGGEQAAAALEAAAADAASGVSRSAAQALQRLRQS